jgi:hypothetical protein
MIDKAIRDHKIFRHSQDGTIAGIISTQMSMEVPVDIPCAHRKRPNIPMKTIITDILNHLGLTYGKIRSKEMVIGIKPKRG